MDYHRGSCYNDVWLRPRVRLLRRYLCFFLLLPSSSRTTAVLYGLYHNRLLQRLRFTKTIPRHDRISGYLKWLKTSSLDNDQENEYSECERWRPNFIDIWKIFPCCCKMYALVGFSENVQGKLFKLARWMTHMPNLHAHFATSTQIPLD